MMNPTIADDRLQDYRTDPAQTHQGARIAVLSYRDIYDRLHDANQHHANAFDVREYHDLFSVLAGLIPADEEEAAIQQAAELQRAAEAMRVKATFVTAERRDTCTDPEFGSKEWFEQIPPESF